VSEPAFTRLPVDERYAQLLEAGSELFAQLAYEEISMAQIARHAGVSKPLLYHYFPSKLDLFKAVVAERAAELLRVIEQTPGTDQADGLSRTLDAYLGWIERNDRAWAMLLQSASAIPSARELLDGLRQRTLTRIVEGLTGTSSPTPALRTMLVGWLGFLDAAILDWLEHRELTRAELRDLVLRGFGAALMAGPAV
jgi:AcrR family transcriptional regulator